MSADTYKKALTTVLVSLVKKQDKKYIVGTWTREHKQTEARQEDRQQENGN